MTVHPVPEPVQLIDEDGVLNCLSEATVDPRLRLGADYSEAGPHRDVACYAVSQVLTTDQDRLDRYIHASARRHVPSLTKESKAEIHMKDIWDGHRRASTDFAHLGTEQKLQAFLLALTKNVQRVVPYSVVVCKRVTADETKAYRGTQMLTEATAQLNIWLAIDRSTVIGDCTIEVDQGDGMSLMRGTSKGGVSKGKSREYNIDLQLVSDPTYKYVRSSDSRIVQVADLSAFVVGKLVGSLDKGTTANVGPDLARANASFNFFYRLADNLNLAIDLLAPINDPEYEPAAWEAPLCGGIDETLRAAIGPRPRETLAPLRTPVRYPRIPGQLRQGFFTLRPIPTKAFPTYRPVVAQYR